MNRGNTEAEEIEFRVVTELLAFRRDKPRQAPQRSTTTSI